MSAVLGILGVRGLGRLGREEDPEYTRISEAQTGINRPVGAPGAVLDGTLDRRGAAVRIMERSTARDDSEDEPETTSPKGRPQEDDHKMRRTTTTGRLPWLVLVLSGLAFAPAAGQDGPRADPADVESLDAIIAAVYDVISGPAGEARDWDRWRSLFAEGARLIPIGGGANGQPPRPFVITPDGYAERSGPVLERDGFFETEIGRTVEQYGPLVHLFSAYESRRSPDDAQPFARGINSFQLLNDGTRWWVVTVFWQSETPDLPIPAKYIGR